jgi:hypothetical protein
MARARIDYRHVAGGLFLGTMCTLFALSCLLFVVGTAVPPVLRALGQEPLGAGQLVGSVLAGLFFAPIGLFTLRGVWRELRGRGTAAGRESPVAPAALPAAPVALADGPGLALRWLAAVPLMLLAALGPVLASAGYRGSFSGMWPLALLPLAVTAGFLLHRKRMASWPTAVALMAFAVLGLGSVASLTAIMDPTVLKTSLLLAVIAATYWLGRLADLVLTRPVTADVVRSDLEIAFRLPRQLPRLRVQQDGLTLDRMRRVGTPFGAAEFTLTFAELTDVRVETRTSPTRWTVTGPASREIAVPAGPAVRVEAGSTTWLLPARSEEVARTIVTVIALRGHR